ncbi:MAG: tetratricopeptide repeat protein [Chloroflexales bacterium]|nr:tetratricopeptide repeat protein [Chloroflexales bacterium]
MMPRITNPTALRAYLAPDLAAHLDRTGDLPAGARARLAADLRAEIAACAAFIPARLVRAQLSSPHPGRVSGAFWEGSLLFADLSGFTALSERLSVLGRQGAEEVSAVVSRLFDALIAEVHARQGVLLKFGGDALTAFFDAEALGPVNGAAASAAALAMQRRMDEFIDLRTRAGTFTLRLRVGVHSGRVFAAEVGDVAHVELVVTGPEVNRVAMAQEIAEPGQVVVTDQTAELIPGITLRRAGRGFHLLEALPHPDLPPPPPDPVARTGPDDLSTLARLADELTALRPYLVRGLPRRFLEATETGLGEFRPVSVLFANVHDFSAILAGLHQAPDTAAAVFNAYYRRAQQVVHRYEGIVNKVDMYTHGDKLMVLFGAPMAHEDDPTRAGRCALELAGALDEANAEIEELLAATDQEIEWQGDQVTTAGFRAHPVTRSHGPPVTLSQKIGLNTGTVFAGRVGGATRYEYTVMGPAVNLAARLMSVAADGEVLLSPSARTAVAGQIELVDGPTLQLKGIPGPVVPARALRVAAVASAGRDEGRVSALNAAPLIGRDAELSALIEAGAAALAGRGRVLALVGEAGAGKTRLAEELLQRLAASSVAPGQPGVPAFEILISECQSYEQRTPYAALRGPLRGLLSLGAHNLGAPDLSAHLSARIEQIAPELARFAPLLGDALGLGVEESTLTASLTPEQRHDRLQDLVVALFQGSARCDPLFVLVEDAHWADLPSQELMGRLAAAAEQLSLLLVFTYRPEPPIQAPWDDLPLTERLTLGELSTRDSAALLAALLGGSPPPAILPLLDRTQGNPFFIEELVRALVTAGVLRHDHAGAWQIDRKLEEVELPKSIEGLLIARLDRLDEPRQELIHVASVIGRRFQRPVVEGVYTGPAGLEESLQRLVGFELIQAEQLDRALAYLFRHALLRDVAYEGILYARRRLLHRRVARRIEELSRDNLDDGLSILAWHYLQAEDWAPALDYHMRAADQAARRFANRDALALYAAALEIAPRLSEQADPAWLTDQVATLHERSGDLRLLLGEYDDAEAHLREALRLATAASERWLRLHRLLAMVEERRSRYDEAFIWLQTGMARATADLRGETARCYILGSGIYFRQGEYTLAMEWARMGLGLAAQVGRLADQAHALKLVGNIYRDQGELIQAIGALEQARDLFAKLNILSGQSDALNNLGQVYLNLGRWSETITSYEQSLRISESIGDVQAIARTTNNLAVVLVGRNQLERAGELYKLSSEMFGRMGSALGVAVTTANRAEVLLLQGRPAEAIALVGTALSTYERIKARNFLPDALRYAAEAALALGDLDAAEAYAARSHTLAAELGMAAEEAIALRVSGQIALARRDLDAACAHLEASRAALAQLDNRYELGRTRYQQAHLARAHGDAPAFAAARVEAATIFAELDAQRDLALARELG